MRGRGGARGQGVCVWGGGGSRARWGWSSPRRHLPPPPPRSTGICTFDPGFGSTASCESAITYIDGAKGVLLYRGCGAWGGDYTRVAQWRQAPRSAPHPPPFTHPPINPTHTCSYPIEELASEGDFLDSTFVLLHGELPNKARGGACVVVPARPPSLPACCLLLCHPHPHPHPQPPSPQAEKAAFEREIKMHTLVHEQLIQFYRGFRHDAHPMAIMCGVVGALSAFYPEVSETK